MLETQDLILDKAKRSDWRDMYQNVWSRPESAKYMLWQITTSEQDAQMRMQKTIEFQKTHDTYLVYEKGSGKAIGFAGVERTAPYVYQEAGICLGPDYVRKGFGRQIVRCLIQYCKAQGAKEFRYFTRSENWASMQLARSLGFTEISSESKTDDRDGHSYQLLQYGLTL